MKISMIAPETRELLHPLSMTVQHMYLNTRSSAVYIRTHSDIWVAIDSTGVRTYTQKALEAFAYLYSEIFYRAPEGYRITFQM